MELAANYDQNFINEIREQYEFLTFLKTEKVTICGVTQSETNKTIAIYDYTRLRTVGERAKFLSLCDDWWWGSGQMIPINMYHWRQWDHFHYTLVQYPKKALVQDPIGPIFNLNDLYPKKPKKKRVEILVGRDMINPRLVASVA